MIVQSFFLSISGLAPELHIYLKKGGIVSTKKSKSSPKESKKSKKMPVIEHQRVLTAEGWKQMLKSYHREQKQKRK